KLFFGGNTGVAFFESGRIISNISDAPVNVVLTELSVNGEVMSPKPGGVLERLVDDTDRIVLRSSQNTVGLKFDYVSFIADDNVNFSYRLSCNGSPAEWIDIGGYKSVNFSHLLSGHYVFELASTNFDGFRSKEPRRLEIVVKKSPWISWYSILIYVLAVSITVFATVHIIMQRRVKAAELQVMKEELERVTSLFRSSVDSYQDTSREMEEGSVPQSGPQEDEKKLSEADREFINDVTDYIVTHMTGEPISIDSLSEEMCMSRASFFRKMKSLTGMTPNDFILSYRLDKAASMLKEGRWRINEISDMLGFSSPSHFAKVFKNKFGVSPKEWR
ncbi:MAG: helix-turn-helix domain-containing protein, partial [Candidatus Cryptobacteroides sp.]